MTYLTLPQQIDHHGVVPPIGEDCRREVVAATQQATLRAGEVLGIALAPIPVHFDLKGAAAGMFTARAGDCAIRYNPWLFAKHFALHLRDTVPHEVAHYGIHRCFPKRRVRPHGPEWQALVTALGGNPQATFSADLTGIPLRRQRRHRYRCDCRTHDLSTTRHNRVQRRGEVYCCRRCNGRLVPV